LLWGLLDNRQLIEGEADRHMWELSKSGIYSSKSAYMAFFKGAFRFAPWKRICKSWAPPRCKFFVWLVVKRRCRTEDRLAKWRLPHPAACSLFNQETETINHLLVSCVFARQVWFLVLQGFGLSHLTPAQSDGSFSPWWPKSLKLVPKEFKKGMNSLIILVSWELWKHRKRCVFDGMRPDLVVALQDIASEGVLWCSAGDKGLQQLFVRVSNRG
jgi:hypothetical protein